MVSSNTLFMVKNLGWTPLCELKNGQIIQTESSEIEVLVFMVNPPEGNNTGKLCWKLSCSKSIGC